MKKRRELLDSIKDYEQEEMNPVLMLKQKCETRRAFKYIKTKFESSDYFASIMKYVHEGLIGTLIDFLKEGE